MRTRLATTLIATLAAAACGGAPRRAAPLAEREVAGPAAIAGTWLTSDDLDWSYRLVIGEDGAYVLTIDRGKIGPCEQTGTLAAAATARRLDLALAKDGCTQDGGVAPRALEVVSFTGDALSVRALGGEGDAPGPTRAYQREPAAAE